MPGRNTYSEYHKDCGIESGDMNFTRFDDQSLPAKADSGPGNTIARLEDEIQNSKFFHMEIQNNHGNSIAPNVALEGDEENQIHIAKENEINHQEWTRFQQGGGEEDNEVFMSNLSDLDNSLTERDHASEAVDLNRVNMKSDATTDVVEDVCNGLLNKRNMMKRLRISEETFNLAGNEMEFSKKMDLSNFFDSHVLQIEEAISKIQNVDSGDHHLRTLRLGCLATCSPDNKPTKNGASRELRRASLIPPHGANRFSSSFMPCESSRVRSFLFPIAANRFLSVTSGGFTKTQSCKEQQVDCSNHLEESCTLMVEESSNTEEGSHLQTGGLDNKQYCEETQCGVKDTMAGDGLIENTEEGSHLQTGGLDNKQYCEETQCGVKDTMAGDGLIEVKAKRGPLINNMGQQDPDMIDSAPFGFYYLKNLIHEPDEPQVFQNEMEVQHVDEEGIKRDLKTEAEINANLSNPLVQSEAKGKIVDSMFKNDYKKKPVFKKFRNMNNLARISSMREGILAHRRSFCLASAPVNRIFSSQKVGDESKDPTMVDHTEGNATNNKSETKTFVFSKKRFLEKALLDSAKRLQAHKMLRSGVYDGLSVPRHEIEANNNIENNSSKEMNQTPLNVVKCESESYSERMTEQKRRRREQFKKTLVGKSRDKTKEIAERVAVAQRSQVLQSKRGELSDHKFYNPKGATR